MTTLHQKNYPNDLMINVVECEMSRQPGAMILKRRQKNTLFTRYNMEEVCSSVLHCPSIL